ncbi:MULTISPECIES: type IV pilus secretin PilQ [unclassified Moraxella]|uniref:type IV pilus secretin PilQ n=1 Tax=unclassified Moraxella TaxID=2685852 RepID=UPI002B4018B4|nr:MULTISPECIES: type IV pilus secretin PilQ [unclassified Moraxella]
MNIIKIQLAIILMLLLAPKALASEPSQKSYQGKRISIEFQDMPVRTVLDVLAHAGEANIVASDGVTGNITLRLNNIPWEQALDVVVDAKHLIKHEQEGVIRISSADELAQISQRHAQSRHQSEQYLPLQTEYIHINHAEAKDILALITHKNDGDGSTTMLSKRGMANVDARTNTLIIKDIKPVVDDILALVTRLDVPVQQVMIEARIVSANDGFSRELGVSFGLLSNAKHLQIGGSHASLWDMRRSGDLTNKITRPANLSVNLGATNPAGRIAFGLINLPDVLLDLELSAMQANRLGEVISTPKVLTADKQTARISSGMQIAYQEETSSGATNVAFKEAALVLEATPTITLDGKIHLKLNVKNGTPVTNLGVIAIQEDALETNVIVDDGQTVVLGGIYRQTNHAGVTKVPFFGDLPAVGHLFRQENRTDRKEELLIFVTPKLVPIH